MELLLNRASQWLDVDSYLPVEGKVVLRIKDAPRLAVRMPAWSNPPDVQVSVGDRSLSIGGFGITWNRRFCVPQ